MLRYATFIFLLVVQVTTCFADGDTLGLRLQHITYPFPVKILKTHVQQKAVEIAYMYELPAHSNGNTVLLLHGKNFPGAYWGNTIKALTNAGYTVLAPDALGFGKSSKPIIQYSFSMLAELTLQLMDSLHIREVSVIGHSMGGMLGTRLALAHPARVRRLILADPLGLEDWRAAGVPYRLPDVWAQEEKDITYEQVLNYHKQYYSQWNEIYRLWADVQYGELQGNAENQAAMVSALQYDMIVTQPVLYEFKDLSMPVLLIVGEDDHTKLAKGASPQVAEGLGNYKKLAKHIAKMIPDAEWLTYKHCGHLPQFEQEERFYKDVLYFLQ